ncbi:MAG: hypothetical protein LBE91_06315 [Tannerella sp.]|jgi:hypothetical protein|nr:hypothetical protein [Tannerella sp.]
MCHNPITTKDLNRKFRVLRLLAVVQTYHYYTMMQMNRQLLQYDTSWEQAEHLSHWMNILMPYKASSPTDFLHDKNEVSDTVLTHYEEFKRWIIFAEGIGITEKTLMAFCKNVDHFQSAFLLKVFGHIFYPDWLKALYLYLDNGISKPELQNIFVEYSLFTGKPKPANIAAFRKTVLDIEKNISEITDKQIYRSFRKIIP